VAAFYLKAEGWSQVVWTEETGIMLICAYKKIVGKLLRVDCELKWVEWLARLLRWGSMLWEDVQVRDVCLHACNAQQAVKLSLLLMSLAAASSSADLLLHPTFPYKLVER
jgi:hypothetical protein